MVERKLYKTKLCVLYQKGHCPRQTCHFAHGDAELRRFSAGSFNGRREYRDSDSRDELVRRHSSPRRYSPGRDERGRHSSHGYSPPKLIRKRSDGKCKKKHQLDGQSDFSESLETSDETEGQVKAKKPKPFDSKDLLNEKLREMQSEIDTLDDRKHQLQISLEERVQQADSLTSKIKELEMQLRTEKEECKRISSKIKKFIRAHNRHSRLQDELKRSEARLQKLGEKIYSDAIRPGATEEDTSINILSDGETLGNHISSPRNELQKKASPIKKRPEIHPVEVNEESKEGNPSTGERSVSGATRLEKLSRWDLRRAHLNKEAEAKGNGGRPLINQDKHKRGKDFSTNVLRADKVPPNTHTHKKGKSVITMLKSLETGILLPSTSIAAHAAAEEVVEDVEMDEKLVKNAFSTRVGKRAPSEIARLPFQLPPPPPLPVSLEAYLQYEGDNENVDVDGLDEEMVDVDID